MLNLRGTLFEDIGVEGVAGSEGGGEDSLFCPKSGSLFDAQKTDSNIDQSGPDCFFRSSTAACAPTIEEKTTTPVATSFFSRFSPILCFLSFSRNVFSTFP